jgi:hypothetical protein
VKSAFHVADFHHNRNCSTTLRKIYPNRKKNAENGAPVSKAWPSLYRLAINSKLLNDIMQRSHLPNFAQGKDKAHPITGHEDSDGVQAQLYSFFNLGTRWGRVVKATPRLL